MSDDEGFKEPPAVPLNLAVSGGPQAGAAAAAEAEALQNPLHGAAQNNKEAEVRALVLAQADVEAVERSFGWTALHVAAGNGAAKAVTALLDVGARADAKAKDGEAPLHLAAAEGHTAIVRLLAEGRAEVNAANADGETPLHVAVQHIGSKPGLSHIRELLAQGADLSLKDKDGHDPTACAGIYTNRAEELRAALGGAAPERDADDPWPDTPGELPEGTAPIEAAESLREAGNGRFKKGQHAEALKLYLKAKAFLPTGTAAFAPTEGDAAAERARVCSIAVSSNAAACELKLGKHEECARRCDTILTIEPNNTKALYRKGVCLRALGDDADEDPEPVLLKAAELEPDNAAVRKELAEIAQQKKKDKDKEKRLAQKMFG